MTGSTIAANLSAQDAARRMMEVGTNNLSNAMNEDYVAQKVVLQTNATQGKAQGVRITDIKRQFDQYLHDNVMNQTSKLGEAEATHDGLREIQRFFGLFGEKEDTSHLMTEFFKSLDVLSLNPTNPQSATDVMRAAEQVAEHIKTFADGVQKERLETETLIDEAVEEVNKILDLMEQNNREMAFAQGKKTNAPALLDRRDALLRQLSEYLPVENLKRSSGGDYIQTKTGIPLLISKARHLSFNPSSQLSAQLSYPNNGLQGIFDVDGRDISNQIKSGKLRGLLDLRDKHLPQTQEKLDELTVHLTKAVNAIHNCGTSYRAASTLTGEHKIPGANNTERDTMALNATGTLRVAVMNTNDNKVVSYHDLDMTTVTNVGDFRNAVNAAIQGDVASFDMRLTAGGTLEVTSGAATLGVAITSVGADAVETETGKGICEFFRLNDFYTIGDVQPPKTLTSSVTGLDDADGFDFTGTLQIAVVDKVSGTLAESHNLDLTTTATLGDVRAAFNGTLTTGGFDMSIVDGALVITSGDDELGIQINSIGALATENTTGESFEKTFGLQPDTNPRLGAANTIRVKQTLKDQPALLARSILTDQTITPGVTEGIAAGDTRIVDRMVGLHKATQDFAGAGDLNPVTTTLESYAASILGSESRNAANAKQSFEQIETLKVNAVEEMSDYSGVNVEQTLNDFQLTSIWYNAILASQHIFFNALNRVINVAAAA